MRKSLLRGFPETARDQGSVGVASAAIDAVGAASAAMILEFAAKAATTPLCGFSIAAKAAPTGNPVVWGRAGVVVGLVVGAASTAMICESRPRPLLQNPLG